MPAVPAYLWLAKYTIIVVCIKVVHVGRKENCFIGSAVLFSPFPRLYVHTYLYPQVDTARLRSPASVSRVRQHRIAIALFIYSMKMWARRTIFSIPFHHPLPVSPPGPVYPLPRLRYLCIAMYIHCNSPSDRHDDNDNLRDWPHTSSIHPQREICMTPMQGGLLWPWIISLRKGGPQFRTQYKIQQRIRQRRRRWEQAWDKQLVVWSIVLLVECGLNRGGQPL